MAQRPRAKPIFVFWATACVVVAAPVRADALATTTGDGAVDAVANDDDRGDVDSPSTAAASLDGAPTTSERPRGEIRCPGDNAAFFEEIKEGGWIGFGETWDFNTCGEGGFDVYAEGATRAWPDMRPRLANKRRPQMLDEDDVLFYATVLPYGAFGSLAVLFALAWVISLFQRRKHMPSKIVVCRGCKANVPVRLEEGGVFCPACGTAALAIDAA